MSRSFHSAVSRRSFLQHTALYSAAGILTGLSSTEAFARAFSNRALSVTSNGDTIAQIAAATPSGLSRPALSNVEKLALREFAYGDVHLPDGRHQAQFEATIATLLAISDDDMLKPFRARAGLPAPGKGIGGWYENNPNYDWKKGGDSVGFAPGHCFGQWLSALARAYAINGSTPVLEKLKRLVRGYDATICSAFYENFRFPAYTYDKLVCGLTDAYEYAGLSEALPILQRTTDAALPNLPPRALERGEPLPAHPERDDSFRWDESYTLPENLFRAYQLGCGEQYRELAMRFLNDKPFFTPLAQGRNPLPGKHAYSYMNSLSSAMRAYLVTESKPHFTAAKNALDIIHAQSYSTGGWGPDETFVEPGKGTLGKSLDSSHHSFETCGGYAHMKLTRYLLRTTGDASYGDSMERVIQNTVLGVKGMEPDGSAFYYSDYNLNGHKDFYWMKCPCCAGTLPQIVADYRVCTYLQDADGPLVNLYIPSTLKWKRDGAELSLTQHSEYPLNGRVSMKVTASRPQAFDLRLRIPGWTTGEAKVSVNGKTHGLDAKPGTFASIKRKWKSGDRIDLDLPMSLSVSPVDQEHPDLVALSYGGLALMAIHPDDGAPKVTREELLAAKRSEHRKDEWLVQTSGGALRFVPFTSIDDERYSAYVRV